MDEGCVCFPLQVQNRCVSSVALCIRTKKTCEWSDMKHMGQGNVQIQMYRLHVQLCETRLPHSFIHLSFVYILENVAN